MSPLETPSDYGCGPVIKPEYVLTYFQNGSEIEVNDPDDNCLGSVVYLLDKDVEYLVYAKYDNDQQYIQAAWGPRLHIFEYRDGGEDNHFQYHGRVDLIRSAFKQFRSSLTELQNICKWERVEF